MTNPVIEKKGGKVIPPPVETPNSFPDLIPNNSLSNDDDIFNDLARVFAKNKDVQKNDGQAMARYDTGSLSDQSQWGRQANVRLVLAEQGLDDQNTVITNLTESENRLKIIIGPNNFRTFEDIRKTRLAKQSKSDTRKLAVAALEKIENMRNSSTNN